jgi:hypothetical protein
MKTTPVLERPLHCISNRLTGQGLPQMMTSLRVLDWSRWLLLLSELVDSRLTPQTLFFFRSAQQRIAGCSRVHSSYYY